MTFLQHAIAILMVHWIVFVLIKLDNVNVVRMLMDNIAINVKLVFGNFQLVNDVIVMDMQPAVLMIRMMIINVLSVKISQRGLIVTGKYVHKGLSFNFQY